MAIDWLEFSQKSCGNDGVLPYIGGQPGFRLQEEELREEACCWFSKDALTVSCFKSPSVYIHAIQRVSLWGVGEWGRRGAEPVFHAEVRRPPPHGAKRDRKTPSGLGKQGEGPSTTTNPAPDTSLTSTGHYFLPRNELSWWWRHTYYMYSHLWKAG